MLINIRISELLSNTSYSVALAIITSIFYFYSMSFTIPYNIASVFNNMFTFNFFIYKIFYTINCIWDGSLSVTSHITSIGNILYTSHSIWLILISIILLLAMVGSIILVVKHPLESSSVKGAK